MNRQVIFRHYAWIAVLSAALGIGVVFVFATVDRMPLVGSVMAAVLAFCYFVQQQKLAEIVLFKDLFTDFNRRYDGLNDRLTQIAASGAEPSTSDRQIIVDYFNLCAEEYLFFSEGYIHRAVWQSWCAGMLWYFDREPFRTVWEEERVTNSYYGLSVEAVRRWTA